MKLSHNALLVAISSLLVLYCYTSKSAIAQEWVTNVSAPTLSVPPQEPLVTSRSNYFWQSDKINVCWENPEKYRQLIKRIELAVSKTWERHSGLSFKWRRKCDTNSKGLRVYFDASANSEPHNLKPGRFLDGVKNGIVLNPVAKPAQQKRCIRNVFGDGCVEAWATHQFGHALGLTHKNALQHNERDPACSKLHYSDQAPYFYYNDTPAADSSVMKMCEEPLRDRQLLSFEKITVATVYGNPTPIDKAEKNIANDVTSSVVASDATDMKTKRQQPFWTGTWDTSVAGRSYSVTLKQIGDRVTGTYVQQVSNGVSNHRARGEINGTFSIAPEKWQVMNMLLQGEWKRTDSQAPEQERGSFFFQGRANESGERIFSGRFINLIDNQTRSWNGSVNTDEF